MDTSYAIGESGMPTCTKVPPGANRSTAVDAAFSFPLHSKTMLAPIPSLKSFTLLIESSFLGLTPVIGPSVSANRNFSSTTSRIITLLQPPAIAQSAVTIPMVPAPITTAISPITGLALTTECIPTETGSIIAPSANDTLSGSLKVKAAG